FSGPGGRRVHFEHAVYLGELAFHRSHLRFGITARARLLGSLRYIRRGRWCGGIVLFAAGAERKRSEEQEGAFHWASPRRGWSLKAPRSNHRATAFSRLGCENVQEKCHRAKESGAGRDRPQVPVSFFMKLRVATKPV